MYCRCWPTGLKHKPIAAAVNAIGTQALVQGAQAMTGPAQSEVLLCYSRA